MSRYLCIFSVLVGSLSANTVLAQHSGDLLVDYQGGKVFLEPGEEFPNIYESEFNAPNILLGQTLPNTDEPGFDTLGEETGIFNLIPGDVISYVVLGPLVFHDGVHFQTPTVGLSITKGLTTLVTASSGVQGPVGIDFIVDIDGDGVFHEHLDFELTSAMAPAGAYAVNLQLDSSNPGIGPSDPFWLVFNWNLSEAEFETAVEAIAVPEASSLVMVGLMIVGSVGGGLLRCRRVTHR